MKDARTLLNAVVANHAEFYRQQPHGELAPMFVTVHSDGGIETIPVTFKDEYDKRILCAKMRIIFQLTNVQIYAFFSESWAASYRQESKEKMPSEREDRVEVIMTVAADRVGNKVGNTLELVRDFETGGIIELKPWGQQDDTQFVGRFADLLD